MSFFICRRCLFHDSVHCVLKLQHWRYFLNDSFSQKLEAPEQCFRVPRIVGSWSYIIFSRRETSADGKRRRAEVWDRLRMHILKVFILEKGILFSNTEPKINWESGQRKRSGSTPFQQLPQNFWRPFWSCWLLWKLFFANILTLLGDSR